MAWLKWQGARPHNDMKQVVTVHKDKGTLHINHVLLTAVEFAAIIWIDWMPSTYSSNCAILLEWCSCKVGMLIPKNEMGQSTSWVTDTTWSVIGIPKLLAISWICLQYVYKALYLLVYVIKSTAGIITYTSSLGRDYTLWWLTCSWTAYTSSDKCHLYMCTMNGSWYTVQLYCC